MNISWSIFSRYKSELYGIAILWIMLFHGIILKSTALQWRFINNLIYRGNCGVEIFLFLSGICLFFSMEKDNSIKKFYQKRLLRIFIPLLILDGVYWVYTCLLQRHSIALFIQKILLVDFWISGNQKVWFLALLIPLYLLYPFVYDKIIKSYGEKEKWILIFGLCLIIYGGIFFLKLYYFKWYKLTEIALTRVPVFLIGCGCGNLVYEKSNINKGLIVASFFGAIGGLGYFYFSPFPLVNSFRIPYLFIGPSLAMWICIVLDIINNVKLNKLLSILGELSLELYLSHILIRQFVNGVHLYGNNKNLNYYKYLIVVLSSSFVLSKLVNVLFSRLKKLAL